MTWKSTAVVSGATVLVGWLASTPPSDAPMDEAPARSQGGGSASTAPSEIQEQAARLQARPRSQAVFREPERNPFRFGTAQPAASTPPVVERQVPPPIEPEAPLEPLLSLSGVAENRVADRIERTAVVSSPSGVFLVREGDEVLGQYRVEKIETNAVELIDLTDGTILRLSF